MAVERGVDGHLRCVVAGAAGTRARLVGMASVAGSAQGISWISSGPALAHSEAGRLAGCCGFCRARDRPQTAAGARG